MVTMMKFAQSVGGDESEVESLQKYQKTAMGENKLVRGGLSNGIQTLKYPIPKIKEVTKSRKMRNTDVARSDGLTKSPRKFHASIPIAVRSGCWSLSKFVLNVE